MSDNQLMLHLLVHIQSFETLWAYYSQSSGQLYDDECRESAQDVIKSIDKLNQSDEHFEKMVRTAVINKTPAQELIDDLSAWSTGDTLAPIKSLVESRAFLFGLFSGLKLFIHTELMLPITPTITMSSKEIEYSERALRWRGYLPNAFISSSRFNPDELVRGASDSKTVVVVGDIRRSQELMELTVDHAKFARLMGEFIELTMELLEKHGGFFDKFTGDGFIAYFNEDLCWQLRQNYMVKFLDFSQEMMEISGDMFKRMVRQVHPLLVNRVGLSIGCDIGQINFHDVNHHLIAVGDALVWAHRMTGEGEVGEIIVNEGLGNVLKSYKGIRLEHRRGESKHGLMYSAMAIEFI